ncbi:phosphoribosylpyrophosphate synthetase [Toxoplasma gondii VAND]|uniref:ribose-phosphate diphosphokinase n=1 Tax=Toxoplasma gondii VAND TaxID=933077 RepID=A0A086PIC5_TOXGO|nr:phosphoribosylpyrophosphate synthetase [Toxoplasma gondii VAND]
MWIGSRSIRSHAGGLALARLRARADHLFLDFTAANTSVKKYHFMTSRVSPLLRRPSREQAAAAKYLYASVPPLCQISAATPRRRGADDKRAGGNSRAGNKSSGNEKRHFSFAAAGGLGSVLLCGAPLAGGERRDAAPSSAETEKRNSSASTTTRSSSFFRAPSSSDASFIESKFHFFSRAFSQQPALCQTAAPVPKTDKGRNQQGARPTDDHEEPAHHDSPFWRSQENRPFDRKLGDALLFCGNSNEPLARAVADRLSTKLGKAVVKRFADGEVNIQFADSLRGKDVYIIQPTSTPVNEHLVELLLMISTCRRASAKKITAVIPYYGYARQDRKLSSRVPISAADVARMIEAMGVDRVVAVDLHCGQIQGFFGPRVPVDNLEAQIIGLEYFHHKDLHKPVVVSPDAGGVYRARKFQEGLIARGYNDCGIAMLIKQRLRANEIERMDLVGSVAGSDVIIVDDMIDTAGTLCEAARELRKKGARRVFAFATHGLFSGPAIERIEASPLEEVVVTDSIKARPEVAECPRITSLSISVLLADAIRRIHQKESLNDLFNVKY